MTKPDFLSRLQDGLSALPKESVEERLQFYGEIIDDKVEDGISEEDAVAEIGTVQEVLEQILSEVPLTSLAKERLKPRHTLRFWEIILLIAGSPVWLPLLIAAILIIISVYIVLWTAIITLWSVELVLVCAPLCMVVYVSVFIAQSRYWQALAYLGIGFSLAGISIFFFFACRQATGWIIRLTKKMIIGIKVMLVRKKEKA